MRYLDLWWSLGVAAIVGGGYLVFELGVVVGIDRERKGGERP